MHLYERLQSQQQRKMIDQEIVDVTLFCEQRLKIWGVNTLTSQVNFMLFHLAMALGRIRRGYKVLPLHAEFLLKLSKHRNLNKCLPFISSY